MGACEEKQPTEITFKGRGVGPVVFHFGTVCEGHVGIPILAIRPI